MIELRIFHLLNKKCNYKYIKSYSLKEKITSQQITIMSNMNTTFESLRAANKSATMYEEKIRYLLICYLLISISSYGNKNRYIKSWEEKKKPMLLIFYKKKKEKNSNS